MGRISGALFLFASITAAQSSIGWMQQSPGTSPAPRFGHAMAYDAAHGQVVLFGGQNTGVFFGDTWVWDGSTWTQKFPQTSPPARFGHAMVYDASRGQVVLFGGQRGVAVVGSPYLNDTWTWDGSNWTLQSPQTRPPARFGQSMAFDSVRGEVVMFSGSNALLVNDTWEWDGANWTQRAPSTIPPARTAGAMSYDPARHKAILFGGNDNGVVLNDTWTWDGTNWVKVSPSTTPMAREGAALAWDSDRSQAVLFGGVFMRAGITGTTVLELADTWTWDGTNWTQQSSTVSPVARDSAGIAYDAARHLAVLFGGINQNTGIASAILGDTWTWSGGGPTASSPSIAGMQSASDYGALPGGAPGSWIEIYGSGLAPHSRSWSGADFNGSTAPTSLDDVSVTVAGQPAFVDYISANQVNVQVPSDVATGGPLPVVVTYANGKSTPVNLTVSPTAPGLLAPASFTIGGKRYAVALLPDGVTYVLPAGAIPSLPSRPAKPGETITLYGIGFGSVLPATPAGQIASGQTQISAPLQVQIGQTAANLQYQGLSPGSVGLYQFNVVVPSVAAGDAVPLTFSLSGAPSAQTLYIAVSQ